MALKPIHWVIIGIISLIVPLGTVFVITRILTNPPATWWWTIGVLIAQAIGGLIFFLVWLFNRIKPLEQPKTALEQKEAKAKAIYEKKYDEDDPDNFTVENEVVSMEGESGSTRTPILWLHGKGSETGKVYDAIINLNNSKFQISWLTNSSEQKVQESIRRMAENPASEIVEEKKVSRDDFGTIEATQKIKKMSRMEKEREEEKKEAEEASTI